MSAAIDAHAPALWLEDDVDFLGDEEVEAQIFDEQRMGDGLAEIAEELIRDRVPMIEFCRQVLDYPRLDRVVYLGEGFEFARHCGKVPVTAAMTFVVRDRFGHPIDIAAWTPPRPPALWHSRGCMLGEDRMFTAGRINATGALLVHPTPREWMRAGGRGVVIIDPAKAAWLLRAAGPLQTTSAAAAFDLKTQLQVELPQILFPVGP